MKGSTAVVSRGLVNTTLLPEPENARVEIVGGPGREFSVFGKNYPNATTPPDPEVGLLLARLLDQRVSGLLYPVVQEPVHDAGHR
jgi:hypothetical protein